MFYKMIKKKCDEWYESEECSINDVISYMENRHMLRDVQIQAIKTYLFLKIKCQCKPLSTLFIEGYFNSLDIDELEVSTSTRAYLTTHSEAVALLEYSMLKNEKGEQVSEKIENHIKKEPDSIDYKKVFNEMFYNVSYTEYLFSLPMGAGKTFLMACFIYLDLYFAMNEPLNPAFAHNFIVFAPSGLKASVIPSLKTIQRFEPDWVIPEPAASNIKRNMIFEVLDQYKTKSKSNKTKNPNVQKIANHQPLSELFGLVAVTNAEKVILDRIIEKDGQLCLFEETDDDRDRQANELRNLLGKLPYLSIFIDEMHHAVSDEIKLRAVVNSWAKNNIINSVIGFSGTPYIDKMEKISVYDNLNIGTMEITNVVYYYSLIKGIGNFLKKPTVEIISNATTANIIESGVREFLDKYKDKKYSDGTTAKLGIYCSTIEKLEEMVYPIVANILREYNMPLECILKYHRGNPKYPQPIDSQMKFETLDKDISDIRIVLLVHIGKEGWDCKSLTGIILSQEGDCPNNMVLQTSCRCLRQVDKNKIETALIYLNESNAEKLNKQLIQHEHLSLKEFQSIKNDMVELKRYNRMKRLNVPAIDYYQLRINYNTLIVEQADVYDGINKSTLNTNKKDGIKRITDLSFNDGERIVDDKEYGDEIADYTKWLYYISKNGFGTPSLQELKKYDEKLKVIFNIITYNQDDITYFSSKYDRKKVESNIRKAFFDKREYNTIEELVPEKAKLLKINNFTSEVKTEHPEDYYPDSEVVEKIIKDDNGKLIPDKKTKEFMDYAQRIGNEKILIELELAYYSHKNKDRSFHYLPYKTDSKFEQKFIKEVLSLSDINNLNLELYYNGDDILTEFNIKCYKNVGNGWIYVGAYFPDFVIIKRKNDNEIEKMVIVETKGGIYANDNNFIEKKKFMEKFFIKQNNKKYGYERFSDLYFEDSQSEDERIITVHKTIKKFFGGE